jgi:hypothetical protein
MRNSKNIWPQFPIYILNYSLLNRNHAIKEAEALRDLCLCLESMKGHGPHDLVVSHVRSMGLTHPNMHLAYLEEDKFKGFLF